MPLSKIAQKILSYLNMYDLTPTQYSNRLSNKEYKHWSSVDWFATAVGRVAFGYEAPLTHGLFKTGMQELLDAGY